MTRASKSVNKRLFFLHSITNLSWHTLRFKGMLPREQGQRPPASLHGSGCADTCMLTQQVCLWSNALRRRGPAAVVPPRLGLAVDLLNRCSSTGAAASPEHGSSHVISCSWMDRRRQTWRVSFLKGERLQRPQTRVTPTHFGRKTFCLMQCK